MSLPILGCRPGAVVRNITRNILRCKVQLTFANQTAVDAHHLVRD